MRVLAYYPIHYGSEYLGYSMESVKDHVDHIVVFYSSKPTYGHQGNIANPDSKESIAFICHEYGAELIDITNLNISRENNHRQLAHTYARNNGYDILLAVDYDEVWQNVDVAIKEAYEGDCSHYGIEGSQWLHFWKSFNEVNRDGFAPIRLFNLKNGNKEGRIKKGTIYHFGYAISDELMRYKMSCHGHKSEIGNGWFPKWFDYKRGETKYLHAATDAYWIETEDFDKTKLPKFMRKHPLYET